MSSLLNHDCMPNVARYDDFDGAQEDNTIVEFRAMHDIPAHAQITQSYFPLSWWVFAFDLDFIQALHLVLTLRPCLALPCLELPSPDFPAFSSLSAAKLLLHTCCL